MILQAQKYLAYFIYKYVTRNEETGGAMSATALMPYRGPIEMPSEESILPTHYIQELWQHYQWSVTRLGFIKSQAAHAPRPMSSSVGA